ncbi:hypothetical protein EW145_g7034, partial [Phellinidium pouzarii]
MFKVVVSRDLGPHVMPVLNERKEFNLVVCPDEIKDKQAWLLENVSGAAGLLCMLSDKVTQEVIEAGKPVELCTGPTLKVVSTMSVGYEHVHLPTLVKQKIRLGYTPEILTNAVADLAVMLALMASRNARQAMSLVNEGQVKYHPGKTVGFLGFGRIAHATVARLIPFGIRKFIYTGNPASSGAAPTAESTARDA